MQEGAEKHTPVEDGLRVHVARGAGELGSPGDDPLLVGNVKPSVLRAFILGARPRQRRRSWEWEQNIVGHLGLEGVNALAEGAALSSRLRTNPKAITPIRPLAACSHCCARCVGTPANPLLGVCVAFAMSFSAVRRAELSHVLRETCHTFMLRRRGWSKIVENRPRSAIELAECGRKSSYAHANAYTCTLAHTHSHTHTHAPPAAYSITMRSAPSSRKASRCRMMCGCFSRDRMATSASALRFVGGVQ